MRTSIIKQMCKCADALAQYDDPCYVLNDHSLSKISENRWKHASSFLKIKSQSKSKVKKKK